MDSLRPRAAKQRWCGSFLQNVFKEQEPTEVLWPTKLGLISSALPWALSALSPPCTWQLHSVPIHHHKASKFPQAPPTHSPDVSASCFTGKTMGLSSPGFANKLAHSTSPWSFLENSLLLLKVNLFLPFLRSISASCSLLVSTSHLGPHNDLKVMSGSRISS